MPWHDLVLLCGIAVCMSFIVWMFVGAVREVHKMTAERESGVERFLDMLARVRSMLAVWGVRRIE